MTISNPDDPWIPGEVVEGDVRFVRYMRGDPWAAGDYLLERFPPEQFPFGKAPNGLRTALGRFRNDLMDWTGEDLSASTMQRYRATAHAWPHGNRIPSATFGAHQRLRGKPDRAARIARYVKKAKAEGAKVLQQRHVDRYEHPAGSADRGQAPTGLGERLEAGFRRVALREIFGRGSGTGLGFDSPQITEVERRTLLDRLDLLADEIRATLR